MSISSIGSSSSFDATQMAQKFFKKADSNGDSSIDKSELKTMLSKGKSMTDSEVDDIFSKMDTDKDGKISESENETQMKKMGKGPGGAPPAGKPPSSGGASSTDNKTYDAKDTNKDGTVSNQEELLYYLSHPEKADENKSSSSGYNQTGSTSDQTSTSTFSISA